MAKRQTFGDKVRKQRASVKKMAKLIIAEKKENGHYSYRQKMVSIDDLQAELTAAKAK